jgi:hypothetical protein
LEEPGYLTPGVAFLRELRYRIPIYLQSRRYRTPSYGRFSLNGIWMAQIVLRTITLCSLELSAGQSFTDFGEVRMGGARWKGLAPAEQATRVLCAPGKAM